MPPNFSNYRVIKNVLVYRPMSIKNLLFASTLLAITHCTFAETLDFTRYEDKCADIGFERRTPSFGGCVLELREREKTQKQMPPLANSGGDGSPEDATCSRYGFVSGTAEYAQCRMQIDFAKNEMQERQRRYEEQLAERKRAKDRARGQAMLMLGLGMMGGNTHTPTSNANNFTPPPPMQIYNLPGGRSMTCSTMGAFTNCR